MTTDACLLTLKKEVSMTVKEIFDLRKQGKIEEAYEAIRPMYAVHKGKYTTLCMFWTASDILKKRIEEGRLEEARKIYLALERMLPRMKEVSEQEEREKAAQNNAQPTSTHSLPFETSYKTTADSALGFMEYAEKKLSEAEQPKQEKPTAPTIAEKATVDGVSDSTTSSQKEDEAPLDDDAPMFDEPDEEPVALGPGPQEVIDVRKIEGINVPQRIVLGFLAGNPGCDIQQISYSLGIPEKSVENHIAALVGRGLVEHEKSTSGYHVKD